MEHPDISFILATGSSALVKAAYQSGTPAIGVGAGNAPVLVCGDANLKEAASSIVKSKSFESGQYRVVKQKKLPACKKMLRVRLW